MDVYFNINNKVLKLAGMWLPHSHVTLSEKIFYYVYDIIILCYCVFFTICEGVKFYEGLADLTVFMFYIKLLTTHIWGSLKLILWHFKRTQIFKVLDALRKSSDDLEEPCREDVMMNTIKTLLLTILAGGVSIAGSFEVFMKLIFYDDSSIQNSGTSLTNSTERAIALNLPYLSWIPFEYRYSRFNFFLAALFQWHPTFQQGILIAAFDMYYVGILSYIAIQFRSVRESYGSIRQRSVRKLGITISEAEIDCPLLRKQMHYEMRLITVRVQLLIKTCRDMEEMFTYLILGQTIFSLTTLCSCLFMVTTLPMGDKQFAMELVFLLAALTELFLFSHTGSLVTNDAQDIPNALFYSDWYTSDLPYKSSIMLIMIRLQKPIYFTIGKFQPISLSTFVSISKAAYSFCAVVKNMDS